MISVLCCLVTLAAPPAAQATSEIRLLRYPAVHEDTYVFTFASDIWIVRKGETVARRITSSPATEYRARISPDGEQIAFTASYDGNPDVYVMPIDGGEPKRLTYEPTSDNVGGWTPDGKVAYISTFGSNYGNKPCLWLVDPKGGLPKQTPILETAEFAFSPDGNKVAYNRIPYMYDWRLYRGGRQGKISIYDLKANSYSELPAGDENMYSPMWVGSSIYYVSDKGSRAMNLFRYDLASKSAKKLTSFTDGDIKWPSTDGKTIIFEQEGYLWTHAIASGKNEKLNPLVPSENLSARPTLRNLSNQISGVGLSPSGVRLLVEARGEIFSVPAQNGETRNLTNTSGARERFGSWSPDGSTIAYVSDASGESQIYVRPAAGGEATMITSGQSTAIRGIDWSPDSKYIAFTNDGEELKYVEVATKQVTKVAQGQFDTFYNLDWSPDSRWISYVNGIPNGNTAVFLYDLSSGKNHQVSSGDFSDQYSAFDLNGKYLYIISSRTVNPRLGNFEAAVGTDTFQQKVYMLLLSKDQPNPLVAPSQEEPVGPQKPAEASTAPMQVDIEGLSERAIALPLPAGEYVMLVGAKNGVLSMSPNGLQRYNVSSRQVESIISEPPQGLTFTPDRTKLAYAVGGNIGIAEVKPGVSLSSGRVNVSDVKATLNPIEEWRQIFWEGWRYERDNFYDPNMRGLDWNAVGKHYASFLPYVKHRSDLTYVLGMMVGELSTSHGYVQEGDPWIQGTPVPVGMLGADYEVANGKIRFARVYKGLLFDETYRGPLAEPGANVEAGDYLLEIDGLQVTADTNPHSLLVDKANKFVVLTVNSRPTHEGSRKVRVRTIGSESNLRYAEWIKRNREYVEKASGGKIGYMHVPDTFTNGAIGFVGGYYNNSDKQALIVDERFNGGGYNPTFFTERLRRKPEMAFRERWGNDQFVPNQAMSGPMAMLINPYAGSGGDLFPYLFKRAKLGPLIGTRTWGGVVGIEGFYGLIDGGTISAPEARWYDADTGEFVLENKGAIPDIEVDARPDLIAKGIDPQLQKAVEYLLGELKKYPARQKPPMPKAGG